MKILLTSLLVIFSLFLTAPGFAWDAASPSVDISDPIYDALDVLNAHDLIPDLMIGQRPFSRSEVIRLLGEASENFKKNSSATKPYDTTQPYYSTKTQSYLENLLIELKQRFPKGDSKKAFSVDPLEKVSLNSTYLNSTLRPYFENGTSINALYNPLTENQQGRHFVDGFQSALETAHSAQLGSYFSLYFVPRLQLQAVNTNGSEENQIFVQDLYATTSFFNTQIDIGRKSINWGQSRNGGVFFSNNARGLDGVQLTNPEPWKIKYIGHLKYTFFFADLGPEQNFSHAQMSGGKISIAPIPEFEFGVARAIIFSGSGAPFASPFDIFKEFFGGRGQSQFAGGANLSNSISGFEFRGRLPFLRGLNLYSEFYFDDFTPEHFIRSLKQDSAILLGVYLPRLNDSGSLSLRIEGRKTTTIMYKHGLWTSGWTMNGFIMGDPLGADAESLHVEIKKDLQKYRLKLSNQFFFERIDGDTYGSNSQVGRFVAVNATPEWRVRDIVSATHEFSDLVSANLNLGYENIKNYNFVGSSTQNNFMIEAAVTLNTAGRFRLPK